MPFHSYQSEKERTLFDLLGERDLSVDELENAQKAGSSLPQKVVTIPSTTSTSAEAVLSARFDGASRAGSAGDDSSTADIAGGTSSTPTSSTVVTYAIDFIVSAPTPPLQHSSPLTRRKPPSSSTNTNAIYERSHSCRQCGIGYDRYTRARDCRNWDLGLKPHACGGACGNGGCNTAYWSEALLREHIAVPVQCTQCGKNISKRNFARHRNEYCPVRSSPAYPPDS